MTQYIGTKLIGARPMTRQEYNEYRGWTLPANEDGNDAGYLVEYLDGGPANDSRHTGYISWSPKEVFDRAYRPTAAMTFGDALMMLKLGYRVARAGWNGKGMFIYLNRGAHDFDADPRGAIDGVDSDYFAKGDTGIVTRMPNVNMRSASGATVTGWLASQTDMLAEDWMVAQ